MGSSSYPSIFCSCGAQWHYPTVENPQAQRIIAKHHTGGQPGPWDRCGRLTHEQYLEKFGDRCACDPCRTRRRSAWRALHRKGGQAL